ncbi:MAG: signal peptide peptidase SppA [Acidobacteriota bacterium]
MSDRKSNLLLWIVVGAAAFLFFVLSMAALALYSSGGRSPSISWGVQQVAVLNLEGLIFDSREFVEQLKLFGRAPGVRAVVVRVNSPGGGVAASQEIYEALMRFRNETKKKVVASLSTVGASGAYYVACAADRIFANPGSITGSIGVIAEWYNYGDLLKWARLQSIVFKSGEYKDTGSPSRPLTDAEKAYFQNLLDNMHRQFIAAVAGGRNMAEEEIAPLADGRVFTGQEAVANGLVDQLGTLEDAVAEAARMAGIPGEPHTISPVQRRISILDLLLGDARSILFLSPDRSESHIRFEYVWR